MGPSGCGKTYFTESLLLDHLDALFVIPPPAIHYFYGAWQDGFRGMEEAGVQFHEGIPEIDNVKSWLLQGGLLVLDDLMAEGGEAEESAVEKWKFLLNRVMGRKILPENSDDEEEKDEASV